MMNQRYVRLLLAGILGFCSLAPVKVYAETEREVWVLAKSHADIPTVDEMYADLSYRPRFVIVAADEARALTSTPDSPQFYFQSQEVTLSADGDTLLAGMNSTNTFAFDIWQPYDNMYQFGVADDMLFRLLIYSSDLCVCDVSVTEMSWRIDFVSDDGVCNIKAVNEYGRDFVSYAYLCYKTDTHRFTNNKMLNEATSSYGMRIYVARMEVVPDPPVAPELYIEDFGQLFDGQTIDLSEKTEIQHITLTAPEGVSIYYRFTEEVLSRAAANTDEAEFTLYESPIEISRAGKLEIYAQDDASGLKSAVQTLHFTGTPAIAPEAPEFSLNGEGVLQGGQVVNLSKKVGPQTVTLTAAAGLEIYYRYITEPDDAAATESTTEPDYQLYTEPFEVSNAGLVDYYSENPQNNLRSEVLTIYFEGYPIPTSLIDVAAPAGPDAVYYDLLGRPVSNPAAHRILIRKLPNTPPQKILR